MGVELINPVDEVLKSLAQKNAPLRYENEEAAEIFNTVNDQMQKDAVEYRERENKSEHLSASAILSF